MVTKQIKGLWVPLELLQNEELTPSEKLVLAEIFALSKDGQCTASNQHIADVVGLGVRYVEKITASLAKKEYIKTKLFRDEKKIIRRVIIPILL